MFEIISFYKIGLLAEYQVEQLQAALHKQCEEQQIKGTIIIAEEGINGALSGSPEGIAAIKEVIRGADPLFHDIEYKTSSADFIPFSRLKVKLKPEVLTFRDPDDRETMLARLDSMRPEPAPGEYLDSEGWNELLADPAALVIDTRNDYEVAIGRFDQAINPHIDNFSQLVTWIKDNLDPVQDRERPIGMYCTGGIRCEKSTAYLRQLGFTKVYHLQGGIIKYLEEQLDKVSNRWLGDLFVFDDRVVIDKGLNPVKAGGR